jgi:hypothetical protein
MKKINRDSLFAKIELFEKLALYGDRRSFLKALAQAKPDDGLPDDGFNDEAVHQYLNQDAFGNPIANGIPAPETTPATNNINVPAVTITNDKKWTPIPTNVQTALNFIDSALGYNPNLVIDGKLGPLTRKAIDWYKAHANQETFKEVPLIEDKYVFQMILDDYARMTKNNNIA